MTENSLLFLFLFMQNSHEHIFAFSKTNVNWSQQVEAQASKWAHTVFKITGSIPSRRSYVLWSCSQHPDGGRHSFQFDDPKLNSFVRDGIISEEELNEFVLNYSGEQFYATRMDQYLKNRKICCRQHQNKLRTKNGFELFQKLLQDRGTHYKTVFTIEIPVEQYKGKHVKIPIKCESHGIISLYSMKDLNTIVSCPCPQCRVDPSHKNKAVEIIQKRNAGRPGQILRHAIRVKEKYSNTCLISHSKFECQHHHVDGQDFYMQTSLSWEHNGVCLCGPVHRDFHWNFLKKHSKIASKFFKKFSKISQEYEETQTPLGPSPLPQAEREEPFVVSTNNPDIDVAGAEVSRYTFLEYIRFLMYDIRKNNSRYVQLLNTKISKRHDEIDSSSASYGEMGEITLEKLEIAMKQFCEEYKGDNWALAFRKDIPYANDQVLWNDVDQTWPI